MIYYIFLALLFLYGIIIGSFLNVCIYRIPNRENIVTTRSHCMRCGYQLKWYDLVPIFSWIFLRGRCRQCKEKISVQYPIIEAINGILFVLTFLFCGWELLSVLYCLLASALLVISVIDWRTYQIPFGINVFILVLGLCSLPLSSGAVATHLIGFCAVSGFLLLIYLLTKGKGIGGGDIKLMATAGLLLGWKLIILAFFFGCLYGSVIHLIRMKVSKTGHVLAMGPYLSAGILTAVWFGDRIISWYLTVSGL